MSDQRRGSHTVTRLTVHLVWVTKYRYPVLNLATRLHQIPGLTALWGIGSIVALLFTCVFRAITLIRIPLIPLLILTTVVTSLVGSLGLALFVGQRLISHDNRSLQKQFLVGLAIVTILSLIPFFGGLVVFLVNLFGLGVILLWRFGRETPNRDSVSRSK